MTLYSYIWPVSFHRPKNKCIIYKGHNILYCGNIGDIPMKYGELLFDKVILTKETNVLRIYVKDKRRYNNV